jgi:MFS family permease
MNIKIIPLLLQVVWSTGFNLVSRILPSFFVTVASATQISLIYSIYAGTKFLAIPCGWVSDKIGKVKTLFLVFLALPLLVISFTISKSVFFFALMFFLIGILGNFYYSSINAVITIFFNRKKTESLFKLESMYQLGATLGPIMGGFLTLRYGIDKAFYTWAGLSVLGLILSTFLFKKEPPETKKTEKPSLKQLFSQLGEKKFDFIILLIVGSFLTGLFESMVTLALPLYTTKIGFDISKVGLIIGLGSLLSIFGLLFLGRKLEKIKKDYSLIFTTFLIGVSTFILIFVHHLLGIILLLGIFTMGRAGGLNITRSFISENLGENIRATGMSISDTVQYIARFVGPPLAGILIDKINIQASFISISAIAALGIILLIFYIRFRRIKYA